MLQRAIAYYRVSTQRQSRSGLGIEAQRNAVERFAEAEGNTFVEAFTEVETGKAPMRWIADRRWHRPLNEPGARSVLSSLQSLIACHATLPSLPD